VNRNENSFFRYHGWPSVCRDDDGVLYAVASGFRLSHICPFGKTCLYKSFDGGVTWSIPMVINDTWLDDRDAGIISLGGKKLLVTWFVHPTEVYLSTYRDYITNSWKGAQGVLDMYTEIPSDQAGGGSYIRISEDGGYTWSETIKVPVSSPHGPTMLADGTLVYLGKAMYTDDIPKGSIASYRSSDGGYTWEKQTVLEFPESLKAENFHEPHAVQLPNGRILGTIRAQGEGVDFGFTIYETHSDDGGFTWSPMKPLGICGSPPHLMVHSSGAVICSFGRRTDPYGERARISRDMGETWEEEYIIADSKPCDLGYPASVELEDGRILTVYYQHGEKDDFASMFRTIWEL